jgi:PAS domain S-box-containing protein
MHRPRPTPSGRERHFDADEIIVSKTDVHGIITYANSVFIRVSGYTEAELMGQPHSIIRHPDMPRGVFKLLWDTVQAGREIFAYVNNMAANGDNYWVLAHVTPSFAGDGTIVGYHSNRRVPERVAVDAVQGLYAKMLDAERRCGSDKQAAVRASTALLADALATAGMEYDEFVFSLAPAEV